MFKRICILWLVIVCVVGCGKRSATPTWQTSLLAPEMSESQFTDAVAAAIRESLPSVDVKIVDTLTIDFITGSGGEGTCNLHNAWTECRSSPEIRSDVVRRHIEALSSTISNDGEKAPPKLDDIVPVIKGKRWLDDVAKQGMKVEATSLASDILVTYAEDGPSQLRFLGVEDVNSVGVNPQELRATAISNLKSRLPKIERMGDGPLYMLASGGTFEASLLLLDSIWEEQEAAVDGRLIAAVPSRDLVLFTGENAPEAIQQMRTMVEEIHATGNYLISRTLLVREGKRWVPYVYRGNR